MDHKGDIMLQPEDLELEKLGLTNIERIKRNLPFESLIEDNILQKTGKIGMRGAIMVDTGRFTDRKSVV